MHQIQQGHPGERKCGLHADHLPQLLCQRTSEKEFVKACQGINRDKQKTHKNNMPHLVSGLTAPKKQAKPQPKGSRCAHQEAQQIQYQQHGVLLSLLSLIHFRSVPWILYNFLIRIQCSYSHH